MPSTVRDICDLIDAWVDVEYSELKFKRLTFNDQGPLSPVHGSGLILLSAVLQTQVFPQPASD